MKNEQPPFKNNSGPEFKGFIENPLRLVFGKGFDQTVCTPDALKKGTVPEEMRPPAAEVQRALAALTLERR